MQVTNGGKPKKIMKQIIKTEPKPKPAARDFPRSPCAVACTLDLVGDKWSLLVVRDLFRGNVTYSELQNSPEGIPTNILANRLKRMEEAGLIARSAYHDHPVRYVYQLTEKGRALSDVLLALVRWGTKHIAGTQVLKMPAAPSGHGGKASTKPDRRS
jgi:DNA-binding HxlR family transcriptional regulator